jgi:hypothetical protein
MPYAKLSSDNIYYVGLGDIANSSDWQDTVADYTLMKAIIEDGATEDIVVGVYTNATCQVWIWVDWNKNFIFDSFSELFVTNNWFNGTITVPTDTPPGDYRMRVRLTRGGEPNPCDNSYYGETEDYTITVVAQPDHDVGVTYINSPYSGVYLGDEIVKIKVKNFGYETQTNIPVFFTIDGGTEVNGIIEGPVFSRETVEYIFPDKVNLGTVGHTYLFNICTALPGDEVPDNDCKTRSVINEFQSYCYASTDIEDEYIANVLIGEIDNTSAWQGGIADYTSQYATIDAGTSKDIVVTNGDPYEPDHVYAWVDWNKDYVLECMQSPERFILTNVGGTGEVFTGQISVPENTINGDYRMRVRMTYNYTPGPCWESDYGEIEDYTIRVVNGQPPELTWLSATPLSGSLAPDESMIVKALFNSNGFENGTYNGAVNFNVNGPFGENVSVPVTLNIGCTLPAPLSLEGFELIPNIAFLNWAAPEPSGDLLGYNVYRDNEKINTEIISSLFFEDSLANPSQYLYFVTAVYPECEAPSDTISLFITHIQEDENSGTSIFPNPVKFLLNIRSQFEIKRVSIMNNLGQVLYLGDFNKQSIQINMSDFDRGIYVLKVETKEGIIAKKLLVQ